MKVGWRISWMCPDETCHQVHRIVAPREEVLDLAAGLIESGEIGSILIQEETVAMMAEMDMAEEGRNDPQKVIDLSEAYGRLKQIRHMGEVRGHGIDLTKWWIKRKK